MRAGTTYGNGVRAQHKAATRQLIVETGDALFVESGFHAVLLEDVASECGLSVRTLLRYFESKEALALSHEHQALDRFRAGLERRRGSVLSYWRHHVGMIAADLARNGDWYRRRIVEIRQEPLWFHMVRIQREYQSLLEDALTAELGGPEHWLDAALFASLLTAASEAAVNHWCAGAPATPFDPDAMYDAVEHAATLFRSSR